MSFYAELLAEELYRIYRTPEGIDWDGTKLPTWAKLEPAKRKRWLATATQIYRDKARHEARRRSRSAKPTPPSRRSSTHSWTGEVPDEAKAGNPERAEARS